MRLRVLLTILFLAACGSNHNNVSDPKDHKDSGQPQDNEDDAGLPDDSNPDAETPDVNEDPNKDSGTPDEPTDSGTPSDTKDSGTVTNPPVKDSGTPDASKPEPKPPVVIVDPDRPVTEEPESDMIVLNEARNQCTLAVGAYLIQYSAIESDVTTDVTTDPQCGALPDEMGDMSNLDKNRLSIPKNCKLGHYYNQDDQCTLTTELICELENGCTETRYTDFNWSPATQAETTWFGDGITKLTRVCPNAADSCSGIYHKAAFPKPQ